MHQSEVDAKQSDVDSKQSDVETAQEAHDTNPTPETQLALEAAKESLADAEQDLDTAVDSLARCSGSYARRDK